MAPREAFVNRLLTLAVNTLERHLPPPNVALMSEAEFAAFASRPERPTLDDLRDELETER